MTKDELITKQALEIEGHKQTILEFEKAKQEIHSTLFNIGAPLNDNSLAFNPAQREVLHHIADVLDIR